MDERNKEDNNVRIIYNTSQNQFLQVFVFSSSFCGCLNLSSDIFVNLMGEGEVIFVIFFKENSILYIYYQTAIRKKQLGKKKKIISIYHEQYCICSFHSFYLHVLIIYLYNFVFQKYKLSLLLNVIFYKYNIISIHFIDIWCTMIQLVLYA